MPRLPRFRSSSRARLAAAGGQASSDYVAVLSLVAVVVAAAVSVARPPADLAGDVAAAMRHAVCLVAGGICTAEEARQAGLEACVVHLRSDGEEIGAVIAVVRLGRGDTVVAERRSDGSAVLSFLDDNAIGAQAGVGLQLGAGATGTAAAGLSFNTGRSYEFGSWARAKRFLARYAEDETTAGEAGNLARRLSPLHGERSLPSPDATHFETGGWGELEADAGVALPGPDTNVSAGLGAARLIGRRRSGERSTWYLRMEGAMAARMGLVAGALAGSGAGEAVLEVTTAAGRVVSAAVTVGAEVSGRLALIGQTTDLPALARRLREASASTGSAGEHGVALQARVTLDASVAEHRAAVAGVLRALRDPADLHARLGALGARLDAAGRLDLAVYSGHTRRSARGARLALGPGIALEHASVQTTRELVQAWTSHAGVLREREDCAEAA